MVCDCCGRKKKLLESFTNTAYKDGYIHFCAECNKAPYRVREAVKLQDDKKIELENEKWLKLEKKPSPLFIEWKKEFIQKITNACL